MKNKIICILIAAQLIINYSTTNAQNCSALKKGMKFSFEVTMYPLIIEKDPMGFMKMNQKEKDKAVNEFKEGISSGKIQPKSVTTSVYTVEGVTPTGEYIFSTTQGDKKFDSYLSCKNDTFYVLRTKGMTPMVSKNDTVGFYSYGAQAIPINLKVGGNTPGYIDESVMASTTQGKVKQNFNVADEVIITKDM
jgi:hypothetical protein